MIITTIKDGFGNQLFMYACGYALARNHDTRLALDTTYLSTSNLRNYELGGLNIKYDRLYSINKRFPYFVKVILRKVFHAYLNLVNKKYEEDKAWHYDCTVEQINGSCILYGYWQSEKYFKKYRTEILEMLTPNYEQTDSFKSLLNSIQNTNSISVHVRRGDYVALGICLGDAYYKSAIQLIKGKVNSPEFYVFSDDLEYAKELFRDFDNSKIHYVSYEATDSTIEDFLLMKSCHHNITANSSYSWWGAWANDHEGKIVICPNRDKEDDFYPNEWIKL